ncbi:hypothetical protein C8J57DRAFT_1489463 [Mycena rebaudengoi]|nr:hypothetical protein C8J57DRAFT_1489463 [Mycena rebaudengoi]
MVLFGLVFYSGTFKFDYRALQRGIVPSYFRDKGEFISKGVTQIVVVRLLFPPSALPMSHIFDGATVRSPPTPPTAHTSTARPRARTHPSKRSRRPRPRLRGVTTRIAKPSVGSIKQKRGAHGEQRKTRGVTDASASRRSHPRGDIGARHKDDVRGERKSGARAPRAGESGATARSPRHGGRAAVPPWPLCLIVGVTRGLGASLPQITAIDISTEPTGLVLTTGSALPAHTSCATIYTVGPVFVVQALARVGKVPHGDWGGWRGHGPPVFDLRDCGVAVAIVHLPSFTCTEMTKNVGYDQFGASGEAMFSCYSRRSRVLLLPFLAVFGLSKTGQFLAPLGARDIGTAREVLNPDVSMSGTVCPRAGNNIPDVERVGSAPACNVTHSFSSIRIQSNSTSMHVLFESEPATVLFFTLAPALHYNAELSALHRTARPPSRCGGDRPCSDVIVFLVWLGTPLPSKLRFAKIWRKATDLTAGRHAQAATRKVTGTW